MSWRVEDRRNVVLEADKSYLTDELKNHLREKYFPRYPTRRAVLLPALHLVQHTYNWIAPKAIQEIAEFLEIAPAEALDTASFYEEYWLKPKGKYLVQVCRSLSCELCGSEELTDCVRKKLGIEAGETTRDGKFTLVELECLGSCGTAPVAGINEVLFENLTPGQLLELMEKLPEDPHDFKDPQMDWEPEALPGHGH